MKILIVGGTRFIGPFVVRQLAEQGHVITVFHRGETEARLPDNVRHIHGNRYKLSDYRLEFEKTKPDVVIDMMIRFGWQADEVMTVFDGLAERVVMISSVDVYRNMGILRGTEDGAICEGRITEDAPLRDNLYPYRSVARSPDDWQYHYDKIPAEKAILSRSSLPGTILRLPMVYGPGDPQHRLFDYIKRMRDGRSVILLDRRHMAARWMRGYVENVAAAIVLAAVEKRAAGRIYNVGEPEALDEGAWVRAIAEAIGWQGEVIGLHHDDLPQHLQTKYNFGAHLNTDCSRLRNELGFRELIHRDEAMNRTIVWETINPPLVIKPEDFDYAAEDAALAKYRKE